MTDRECDSVFKQLESYLAKQGLLWIVDAVNSEIEEGKQQTASVKAYEEKLVPNGGRAELVPSKKAAKADVQVEFTAQERLRCLIDAIEAVVVETAFMQQATITTMTASAQPVGQRTPSKPMSVRFTSPETGKVLHEFNQKQLTDRVRSARRLKSLLQDLRKEI